MTAYLCNSLGYSKQAYYKSLRSSNDEEERERYVLSIVEEIRRDLPRLPFPGDGRLLEADHGLGCTPDSGFVWSGESLVPCPRDRRTRLFQGLDPSF